MTNPANELQKSGSSSLSREGQLSTNLNSKHGVIQRLRRGRHVRSRFVESHISKTLAFQTRALRAKEGWSQQVLAEKIGSNQNAVYRAENPNYGKQTITTLKKIAAAFDVALVVRFVPFSELTDWVSGTPRTLKGLTRDALNVLSFEDDPAFKDPTPEPEPELEEAVFASTAKAGWDHIPDWNARLSTAEDIMKWSEILPQPGGLQHLSDTINLPSMPSEDPYKGLRLVPLQPTPIEAINPETRGNQHSKEDDVPFGAVEFPAFGPKDKAA